MGGRFITFEGGDGAGKSTQARLLAEALRAAGRSVCLTREPGGSPAAERIRDLLVANDGEELQPLSETLLHYAARAEHLAATVRPALARDEWVVSDRFADSTMAYQGYGQGVGKAFIDTLYREVVGDTVPDLTLVLDVPSSLALERAEARKEPRQRYEGMGDAYHARLREGYLEIARTAPERCAIVEATGAVDRIHREIVAVVGERLKVTVAAIR